MKHSIQTAKSYITAHNVEFITGAAILVVIGLIATIVFAVNNSTPKVVYQPAKACDLFNLAEAKELLGNSVISSTTQSPVQSDSTATSKCGYTDGNPDMNSAVVAAIMVRSGINDKGTQQNKTEFTAGKPAQNVEAVKELGDEAYFNQKLGQLNVLDGHNWIILSYGVGSAPEANVVDKAVMLAKKVLN